MPQVSLKPRHDPAGHALTKPELQERFLRRFADPIYDDHRETLKKLADLAWTAHEENHKSPFTSPAGDGYADPSYELSDEWRATSEAVKKAQAQFADPAGPSRILVISGADRNDRSCPGEVSKSRRLVSIAEEALRGEGIQTEVLDLSNIISEYGKNIHPCKACVSTAMPLCHWPCSCYPNYAVDQMQDWMNEIYPMWTRAHGIMIVTPVYWYQAPSALKLMIDRLVCADGGNPDPTSTHGKNAQEAKELEMRGWNYPRHLEGRVFSVFVHGDAEGAESLRAALNAWLTDLHLIPSSNAAATARYIGYYGPYATSHAALDKDEALQEEVRQRARSLAVSVTAARRGQLESMNPKLDDPRPK